MGLDNMFQEARRNILASRRRYMETEEAQKKIKLGMGIGQTDSPLFWYGLFGAVFFTTALISSMFGYTGSNVIILGALLTAFIGVGIRYIQRKYFSEAS